MNLIGVRYVPDFKWEDVVLVAADAAGLRALAAALRQAQQRGSARLQRRTRVYDFAVEAGAADIELSVDRVLWRLDPARADEIAEKLVSLSNRTRPGHNYVDDMRAPAATLVLSYDEYLAPSWLTAGKEPLFPDGFE